MPHWNTKVYRLPKYRFSLTIHSMIVEKDSKMTAADYILLIVEHMVNQGIDDAEAFADYLQELPTMTMQELADQLEILEKLAQ